MFSVCLSVNAGGGYLMVPGPWSQVPSLVSGPRSFLRGDTPVLSLVLPSPVLGLARLGGTPLARTGGRGVTICPGQAVGGVPNLVQGVSPPLHQDRGVPPTAQNQDGCAARALCLLRSRRRTFLFSEMLNIFGT